MDRQEKIRHLLFEGGVEEVIGIHELERKLKLKKQLKIKFGADPTKPDLHLGHAVVFRKLREFQELGHKVIFLIGDATTKIGDPTGKDKTRPIMTDAQIKRNAKTYIEQVGKILKIGKRYLEIRFNSEWYSKMSMYQFLELMTKTTVSQVLERDMFQNRIKSGRQIGLHELVYPIMQGYDSVVLKNDVVLCGSDQKFNELFGRHYQQIAGQEPQIIMITKLLIGLDGKEKMSKSLNNYIGLTEKPRDMYGKIMSLPDEFLKHYFELATNLTLKQINDLMLDIEIRKVSKRDAKMKLAFAVTKIYHGKKAAQKAQNDFIRIFQQKELPRRIKTLVIESDEADIKSVVVGAQRGISRSEAKRIIEQGGVSINGKKIFDSSCMLNSKDYNNSVIKIGKRNFCRLKFREKD